MVNSSEQQHLSVPTDTREPVTPIPIFYMHAGEHPFCTRPGCLCLQNNKQLEALLRGVIGGELKLREVINGAIKWRAR